MVLPQALSESVHVPEMEDGEQICTLLFLWDTPKGFVHLGRSLQYLLSWPLAHVADEKIQAVGLARPPPHSLSLETLSHCHPWV